MVCSNVLGDVSEGAPPRIEGSKVGRARRSGDSYPNMAAMATRMGVGGVSEGIVIFEGNGLRVVGGDGERV